MGSNLARRLRDKIRTLKFQKHRLRMIHHFADLLDRKDDYWAMVPNRERFAFAINGPVVDKQSLQIATIGADTPFWEQIFECEDLQELTLHLPSKEQIAALPRLG